MKGSERIKQWIGLLVERPYIPEELRQAKGPILLHISDTPEEIYSYIIKLVEILNPSFIVHTGDMVDNIKLELTPQRIQEYKNSLNKLISRLEESSKASIYYVMGNHDEEEIVKAISKKGIVMVEGHIMIEGMRFYLNHYYQDKPHKAQYYLYGHSFEPHSYKTQGHVGLNGIQDINVIDLATEKIYTLPYPLGTNQYRKMVLRGIGL